jgi:uncharacterized protein DUF4157
MTERSRARPAEGAGRSTTSDAETRGTPGKRTLVEQADAAGGGAPLPGGLRGKFEGSLGADLGGVRVHTGGASAEAADALGARAYAVGPHIHFARGAFDPASRGGERLLAHEVAHTVQQGGAAGPPQTKLAVSAPGDAHEVEADRAAARMIAGAPVRVSAGAATAIARSPAGDTGQDHGEIYDSSGDAHAAVGTAGGSSQAPLPRARDGQVFQSRNTAVATWGNVTITATRSWMREFLDFYGYGPAFGAGGDCTFNLSSSRQSAVLDIMAQQATACGYSGIDRATGAEVAQQVMATRPQLRQFATQAIFGWQLVPGATMDAVDSWLGFYQFGKTAKPPSPTTIDPPGLCSFNGRDDDVDAVVDTFMDESRRAGLAFSRPAVRNQATTSLYIATHPVDAPGKQAKEQDPGPLTLGIQAQLTKHHGKDGDKTDPLNLQFTAQLGAKLHSEGKMGIELAVQGSASFTFVCDPGQITAITIDNAQLTSTQMAGQVAWVVPFLKGALQVQSFAQAVAGFNWASVQTGTTGSQMRLEPQAMAQVVGGLQVVYTIPGTGQHLQVFAQGQKSATASGDSPTRDTQVAVGLQWNF